MKTEKLALVALVMLFFAVAAVTGDTVKTATIGTNASITISGSVAQIVELKVTEYTAANTLDLDGTADLDVLIANVVERVNHKTGYKVYLTSTNKSVLAGSAGNTDTIPYNLTYNSETVVFDTVGTAIITDFGSKTSKAGSSKDLRLKTNTLMDLFPYADTYTDTLVFAIMTQ